MGIEQKIKTITGRIQGRHKFAFVATFAAGLLVHAYMFTNMLLNHDSVAYFYSKIDMLTSGRWFLQYAAWPSTYLNLPWVIGVFCLLYLSLTAVVLAELFRLDNKAVLVVLGLMLCAYPAVTATFAYLFTADGYMLGIFLAALAVLVTDRFQYGFLPAGVLLALSMGIYQAYVSFAALLVLLQLVSLALHPDSEQKAVFLKILRYGLMAVLGFVLYIALLKGMLALRSQQMNDYMNMNTLVMPLGQQIAKVLQNIVGTYTGFFSSLLSMPGLSGGIRKYAVIFYFLLSVGYILVCVVQHRAYKNLWRLAVLGGGLLLLPLLSNIASLLADHTHTIMQQPYTVLFMALPILLVNNPLPGGKLYSAAQVACGCLSLFLCYQFFITANVVYTKMELRQEKTYSFTLRLANRIETTPGYQPGMPVYILYYEEGDPSNPMNQISMLDQEFFWMVGTGGNSFMQSREHLQYYLENWHGFPPYWYNADDATLAQLEQQALEQGMGHFPELSSVQIVNDVLVVRL